MEHGYTKIDINIENWLVSESDIKRIIDFVKGRFPDDQFSAKITLESGNSKPYNDADKIFLAIKKNIEDGVVIKEITIWRNDLGIDNPGYTKSLSVNIHLSTTFKNVFFYIDATDRDGSYGDWVEGTYSEAKTLAKRFEIIDKEFVDRIKKRFNKGVALDFDGKIKKEIQEEITRDKEIKTALINKTSSKVDSKGVENPKGGFFNKISNNQIVSGIIVGLTILFFGYVLFKTTGINLSNPSEDKAAVSSK